ncbi:MAG TPA: ATP-binding cassette domain-containing protein [Geminicoccaceae bacterium]|nr:ATP-binding cassette domain-containing protein [Geminicoccaceae bacterium]
MDELGATILQLDRVGMRYGPSGEVLREIDLKLAAGSFYFVVGPSGAGKTSLLRLMSLTHPPSQGSMVLFGRDVAKLERAESSALRRRIGMIFQDFRLLEHMTAFDNVALPLRLGGASDEQISAHVSQMLGWLGLGDAMEKKPGELSMGQRQLVSVGRAVIGRPSLLLADKPTSSVDPGRSRRLMHLFLSLHRLGTAVVFVTHNERLVRRHPFPVLTMEAGRLRRQEPAATPTPVPMSA